MRKRSLIAPRAADDARQLELSGPYSTVVGLRLALFIGISALGILDPVDGIPVADHPGVDVCAIRSPARGNYPIVALAFCCADSGA